MNDKKWERYAALGGVAFVALNVIGSIAQGQLPSPEDSGDEILAWFNDKASGIKTGAVLAGLSLIAIVWWFGSLWRRMTAAEKGSHRLSVVSLIGLTGGGVLFSAGVAAQAAIALQVDEVGADLAKLFYVMSTVLISFAGFFLTVHLGAANVLAYRAHLFPRWVSGVGLLAALAFLVSGFGAASTSAAVFAFGFVSFVTWVIWILAVSVQMWRTTGTA